MCSLECAIATRWHKKKNKMVKATAQSALVVLVKALEDLFASCVTQRSVCWEKIWTKFHTYHEQQLEKNWNKLGDAIGIGFDPFFMQSITEKMLTELVKKNFNQEISKKCIQKHKNFHPRRGMRDFVLCGVCCQQATRKIQWR